MPVSTIPKRKASRWNDEELEQLLGEIKAKKSIKDIAQAHERTTNSITGKLAELAADYHFFDERPFDTIAQLTGLTHKQIINAVERRKAKIMVNEKDKIAPVEEAHVEEPPVSNNPLPVLTFTALDETPTLADVFKLLKDIQKKVEVLERVRVRLETAI
jgi:hypothetical protein